MSLQTRLASFIAAGLVCLTSQANQQGCPLYPIAMAKTTLLGVTPNTVIPNIMNGQQPGSFGWLTWNGAQSVGALVTSLTPPGNSQAYVNPDNPTDTVVSLGDWIRAKTGVSNSSQVRNALDALIGQEILVPVWDETRGNGANGAYRVCGFAAVKLISYSLPGNSRITARFMGFRTCEGAKPCPRGRRRRRSNRPAARQREPHRIGRGRRPAPRGRARRILDQTLRPRLGHLRLLHLSGHHRHVLRPRRPRIAPLRHRRRADRNRRGGNHRQPTQPAPCRAPRLRHAARGHPDRPDPRRHRSRKPGAHLEHHHASRPRIALRHRPQRRLHPAARLLRRRPA